MTRQTNSSTRRGWTNTKCIRLEDKLKTWKMFFVYFVQGKNKTRYNIINFNKEPNLIEMKETI